MFTPETMESSPDASEPAQPPAGQSLRAIQAQVGGELSGDPDTMIIGVNALDLAQSGELAFAESRKYLPEVRQSRASAFIVPKTFPAITGRALLRVDQPRHAFVTVMYLFQPSAAPDSGISRHAVVSPEAILGEGVTIRECAVIRPRARIGRGSLIESGCHIGEDVVIGEQCLIGPNVVIRCGCRIGHRVIIHGGTVIGADGFGFVWTGERHLKIPQLGNVVIEDDVELGANVCVDRATMGSTIVKRGTKVDNLVQIAHNDVIGEHVIMAGQVGLAGSVRVGDRVIMAGKAGIADHVTIGHDARLGAASVVIKDIPAGQTAWGNPARDIQKTKRELAALSFLPGFMKQLQRKRTARSTRRSTKRSSV